ncbi:MAG: hypothetical protein EOP33_03950 [Rickettsiaceae bacterium]|nr:MAG: hypothetical protein EOP33_03950 [Rickettsiaceae bacterium]
MTYKKYLILMRHADSLPTIDGEDFNRVLSPRGIHQATKAAKLLTSYQIDKILVSPALRTKQTMEIINEELKIKQIETQEELYSANKQSIFDMITNQSDEIKSLMIIGHNPEIYASIFDMIDDNSDSKNYEKLVKSLMPPAGIVVIAFQGTCNWFNINKMGNGRVVNILFDHE